MLVSRNSSRNDSGSIPAENNVRPESGLHLRRRVDDRGPCASGLLLEARQSFLQGLQIGEDQFGVDRLHVLRRRDPTLDMHDIRIVERA